MAPGFSLSGGAVPLAKIPYLPYPLLYLPYLTYLPTLEESDSGDLGLLFGSSYWMESLICEEKV